MAILNDYGDAGVARVERILQHYAGQLGVDKEYAYAFFNGNGRLPRDLTEFQNYLSDATNNQYNIQRRDPRTGALRYIGPGPTPGKTDQERGGFNHQITNAEDTQVQRFKDFDPGIFAYEQTMANPTATNGQGPVAHAMSLGGEPATAGDGVRPTPSGVGWMSVVNGQPMTFGDEAQARADFAQRSTGAGSPASPSASPGATPPGGTPSTAGGTVAGGTDAGAAGRTALVDANAYGNTQTLQAQIDDAIRRYALARTTEERNQAYLDLQRWQTELGKAEGQQKRYDAMAQALLSASVQLQNNPRDYFKFNQMTSGGRDIFAQMQQAGPAFSGPTGPIEPGSVNDLIARLGIQPSQALPATPAGVQPGAANPHNPELPMVPVPGSAGGPPGALQPGAGAAPGAVAQTSLPAYEQMLAELDRAAGGAWSGNRADRQTVAKTWWDANPARRNQPMPAWS